MISQLKDCNIDSFENSSAICMSTGQEIDFFVVQSLPQASGLVNEKYSNFVKEGLFEVEKTIFKAISRTTIKTNNKKRKHREKKLLF